MDSRIVAHTNRFRKDLLPPARSFYERELGELRRPARGWASPKAGCPFHDSESKTSFSVNLDTGGFYCFGCGAKGGDVVAFVMLRDKVDFKTAAKSQGAWDDGGLQIGAVVVRSPALLVPYLALDFSVDGIEYHSEAIRDEPTTELQQTRRFYAQAKDRLDQIRNGDAEEFEGEEEAQWGILAASWELIQMEVGR
jgi:hypothetical protein